MASVELVEPACLRTRSRGVQPPIDLLVKKLELPAKRDRRHFIDEYRPVFKEAEEREEAELQVLLEYLPQQFTEEEISQLAIKIVQETASKGPSDKGKVMSAIMPQVRGKADGAIVNKIVMGILENL